MPQSDEKVPGDPGDAWREMMRRIDKNKIGFGLQTALQSLISASGREGVATLAENLRRMNEQSGIYEIQSILAQLQLPRRPILAPLALSQLQDLSLSLQKFVASLPKVDEVSAAKMIGAVNAAAILENHQTISATVSTTADSSSEIVRSQIANMTTRELVQLTKTLWDIFIAVLAILSFFDAGESEEREKQMLENDARAANERQQILEGQDRIQDSVELNREAIEEMKKALAPLSSLNECVLDELKRREKSTAADSTERLSSKPDSTR